MRTIELLQRRLPKLFVLPAGPARGYVVAGLRRLGVPYHHVLLEYYPDARQLYHTPNVYIVASRHEGGPKAALESMACGIPLIATRVGQAMDLVEHGKYGWPADVEDAKALAH